MLLFLGFAALTDTNEHLHALTQGTEVCLKHVCVITCIAGVCLHMVKSQHEASLDGVCFVGNTESR